MKTASPVWINFVLAILLAVICAVIYQPALNGDFVYDDMETIVKNRYVKDLNFVPAYFNPVNKEMWSFHPGQRQLYRPLLLTTFALNYALSGLNPWSYHLVNLLLHILNALMVQRLLERLARFPDAAGVNADPTIHRIGSWAGAFLFAVHPLQTEAVSYIVSRSSVLATFLILASVLCLFRSLPSAPERGQGAWRLGSLTLFVLALLTKEIAIVVPLLVVLAAFCWLPGQPVREKFRAVAALSLPYFLIFALYLVPRILLFGKTALESKMTGMLPYLFTASKAAFIYLKLTFLPLGQNVDHDLPLVENLTDPGVIAAPAALLVLVIGLFTVVRRRSTPLFFTTMWWMVALLPNLFLPTREAISEHSAYFPSVGLLGAVGFTLGWLWRRFDGLAVGVRRQIGLGLMAALVIQLGFMTMTRNLVWQNSLRLWADSVQKSPAKIRPRINLGEAYLSTGRLNSAERVFREVLVLAPGNGKALNNLGIIEALNGHPEAAENDFRRALAVEVFNWEALNNLGRLLVDRGRYAEAVTLLEKAVRIQPESVAAWSNLGLAWIHHGDRPGGCRLMVKARRLDPDAFTQRRFYQTYCDGSEHPAEGGPVRDRKRDSP